MRQYYASDKRRREAAKRKKREEKRLKRLNKSASGQPTDQAKEAESGPAPASDSHN
jgi:hypothetical protein